MEEKTVSLSLNTIIRECSINPNLRQDHYYYFSLRNRENIHRVFKYRKFNEDFTSKLMCYGDGNNIIGMVRPSYDEFLDKLLTILNIPHKKIKDDDNLTQKMLDRLEVLKRITTEQELKEEFPLLYKDLVDGRRYHTDLIRMKQQESIPDDKFASGEHYYYSCALKKSLPNFVKTQAVMYGRYIRDRHKLKEEQEKTTYNGYIAKYMDMPKFYMYVIHEYLKAGELADDNVEVRKYVALVEKYLDSPIDKKCSITTDDGINIDLVNIRIRLTNLKAKVNSANSLVNWIILPEGRDYSKVSAPKKKTVRTVKATQQELNRIRQVGEQKAVFYESTPYIAKAIGLKRYKGYVAFIYKNGEVILDREYTSSAPKGIKDNALYHIRIEDFETLSKLDKQVLIKDSRVGRYFHTKNWQKRVLDIINREVNPLEEEKVLQLIKRLK